MESLPQKAKAHFFLCCRERQDGKSCCYKKGAEDMVKELKLWTKEMGLNQHIKVSKSSCLGFCESGITGVVYPHNQWFHKISPENLDEIKEFLIKSAQ